MMVDEIRLVNDGRNDSGVVDVLSSGSLVPRGIVVSSFRVKDRSCAASLIF
jgi:hypothetical protein